MQRQLVDDMEIRAPFSGVVVAKAAQPGEMISPISAGGGFTRTGICSIVDMDSLEVEVDVNEAYINRVKPKQPVDVTLNAYPDYRIPADVIAIIPTADRNKATVRVRIALLERDSACVARHGRARGVPRREAAEDRSGSRHRSGVWVPTARPTGSRRGRSCSSSTAIVARRRTVVVGEVVRDTVQLLVRCGRGRTCRR